MRLPAAVVFPSQARGRHSLRAGVVLLAVGAATVTLFLSPPVAAGSPPPAARPSGWTAQPSGVSDDLDAVSFADTLHGHAVGHNGVILATSDGGRTWTRQLACAASAPCTPGSGDHITATFFAVSFVDASHGWAVGTGGTIEVTVDGGATWVRELACAQTEAATVRQYCTPASADLVTKDLHSVSFVDATHGWAAGAGETILHTDNGGRTWVLQIACLWRPGGQHGPCPPRPVSTPRRDLDGVSFVDANHGVAVGAAGYAIFTTDGGQTWTGGQSVVGLGLHGVDMVVAGYSPRPMTVHAVGDSGSVVVSGAKGLAWYGTGGDNQFSGQGQPTAQDLRAVHFTDRLNGWAVGSGGVVLVTHDEGTSWTQQPAPTSETLRGVDLPDANHGFAVGDGGAILSFRDVPAGLAITGVLPRRLPVDGLLPVTITGHGFTGAAEVSFGKTWARGYTVDSDTQITAVPPRRGAGSVHITVSRGGMTSQVGDTDQVTFATPGGGQWADAGRCSAKCNGAAVPLDDGRVLIVASRGDQRTPSRLTWLYDPASGGLRPAEPLRAPRWDASTVRLRDGDVLVAGGVTLGPGGSVGGSTASAELYSQRTGAWTFAGSMHQQRTEAAATALPNGEALVAGGIDPDTRDASTSVELYDPTSRQWREAAPMHHARAFATAIVLRTGQVLVAGNLDQPEDGSAELYDPRTNAWRDTGSMPLAASYPTLVLLSDGRVLASGGVINAPNRPTYTVPYAQIYDPATGAWLPTGPMVHPSVFHAAVTLPDGRVLVAGGLIEGSLYCPPCDPLSQAELYDPVSGAWRLVTSMGQAEEQPSLALLANGSALMAGSDGAVQVFTPALAAGPGEGGPPAWVIAVSAGGVASLIVLALLLWRERRRARGEHSRGGAPTPAAGRERVARTTPRPPHRRE